MHAGGGAQDADLTIVTVTSAAMRADIVAALRMNRLLIALEQGSTRYCHFYEMDPTRAIHW